MDSDIIWKLSSHYLAISLLFNISWIGQLCWLAYRF